MGCLEDPPSLLAEIQVGRMISEITRPAITYQLTPCIIMSILKFIMALCLYVISGTLSSALNMLTFTGDTDRLKLPLELTTFPIPTGTTNGVIVINGYTNVPLTTASTLAGSSFDWNGTNLTGTFFIQFPSATSGLFKFSVPTPYGSRIVTEMQFVTSNGSGDLTLAGNGGAIASEAFPHGTVWKYGRGKTA
jgi:hypothetical protein